MTTTGSSPVVDFQAGMQVLGYRLIPTAAFDAAGNLKMPADFQLPRAWGETVGKVTASPDWESLLGILGVLATPGTDWSCWRVGVNFRDGILRLIVVRAGAVGESGSRLALNWANNFWPRVGTLREYAGRKRLLPAGLTDAVSNVAGQVKSSPYWEKDLPDGPQKAAFELLKWRVSTGLDLLAHVAEFLGSITTKSKILATVLWFDPKHGSVPGQQLQWLPLHQLYNSWGMRAIHYWWNPGWASTSPNSYPFISSSTLQRKGLGVTDVAHEPWELAGAIYPNGNWPPQASPVPTTPPSARHRICEEQDGKLRCHWERETALAAGEVTGQAIEESAVTGLPARDVSALEEPAPLGPPAGAASVSEAGETGEAAPLVLAYRIPPDEGTYLGGGHLREGVWYPLEEDEPGIPELIALPVLGVVATADGSCLGWRPTGELPRVPVVA